MGRPLIDVEKEAPAARRWLFTAAMVALIVAMIAVERGLFVRDETQKPSFGVTPATEELAFNPFRLKVSERENIAAWYIPYREPSAQQEEADPFLFLTPPYGNARNEPGATILILGGGTRSKRSYLAQARLLHRLGYHVYLFDYRGTGSSPGTAGLESFLEDSLLMLRHVRQRRPEHRMALYGIGVGANLALEMAFYLQENDPGVLRALVLDTPVASLQAFHQQLLERRYGRWFAPLLGWRRPFPEGMREAMATLALLEPVPIFWMHSEGSEVPPQATARLCALTRGVKDFWLVPESAPGQGAERFPLETGEQLGRFLDPFLIGKGYSRPEFERELRVGQASEHFVRFVARPGEGPERPRLPVEVYLLSDKGLYTERRWLEGERTAFAYRLEGPPLLAMVKVFRFVEPCPAEATASAEPPFTFSRCESERDYYQRLAALRTP